MKKIKKYTSLVFIGIIFYFISCLFLKNMDYSHYLFIDKEDNTYKNIYNSFLNSDLYVKEVKEVTKINNNKNNEEEYIYYIYNTHQTEEYGEGLYAVKPTVMSLSYMIDSKLNELGKTGIVENRNVPEEAKKIGGDYKYTYDVTWNFLNEVSNNNKSIKYFFDIHRDGVSKEISTTSINNKPYAKIMFLSGERHENYQKNLENISIMEEYLNKNYPGLLRNTYHQSKYSYNQEFSPFTFLIEVGGQYNTIEEVYNSSVALAEAINYLIEETYEK